MKTEPDALGTAENKSGSAKHERGPDALGTVEMILGAQNMKKGPDALFTAENESRNAKHENGTWRPRYRQKHVRGRKT
jgi:hypothetical protein